MLDNVYAINLVKPVTLERPWVDVEVVNDVGARIGDAINAHRVLYRTILSAAEIQDLHRCSALRPNELATVTGSYSFKFLY